MHQSPEIFHKFETLTNHFIELIVPFFIILPRPFRILCGVLQILFQVRPKFHFSIISVLVVSSNPGQISECHVCRSFNNTYYSSDWYSDLNQGLNFTTFSQVKASDRCCIEEATFFKSLVENNHVYSAFWKFWSASVKN